MKTMLVETLSNQQATPGAKTGLSMDGVLARLPHQQQLQLRTELEVPILGNNAPPPHGVMSIFSISTSGPGSRRRCVVFL